MNSSFHSNPHSNKPNVALMSVKDMDLLSAIFPLRLDPLLFVVSAGGPLPPSHPKKGKNGKEIEREKLV